ncbi:MAG: MSCRAMM family protein [Actinomycetota bacterium]
MARRPFVFALLLAVLDACADSPAAGDSGIRGIVLIGPACPVEVAGSPCPDVPLAAEIEVTQDGELVNTIRSGEDGRFSIDLSPGEYVLEGVEPNPGAPPTAKPLAVTVRPHEYTQVTFLFDSGIR